MGNVSPRMIGIHYADGRRDFLDICSFLKALKKSLLDSFSQYVYQISLRRLIVFYEVVRSRIICTCSG